MSNGVGISATLKTVDRAMQVLHAFSPEENELSIGDLSRRLRIHKSIASRLVASLRAWRLLEQDPATKRVRIGIGAFQLGSLFVNRQPLYQLALPHLGALVERTRHSAHVGVLDELRLLVVASVESPQALRVILRVGQWRYLHATAAGKLLLAFGRKTLLDEVVRKVGLPALTPRTITSLSRLERELGRIRAEGIARNLEESTRGAGALAAPIFGSQGEILAALSTVFPLSVVEEKELTQISEGVRETAAAISKVTGGIARPAATA
jgi:DNA-binding IclR family transcriptional regulator